MGKLTEEISAEENLGLYDELTNKHKYGIYAKRPNPIGEILVHGREKFVDLERTRQVYVLTQILNLSLICNSANADLKEIGGRSDSGFARINKKISNYTEFKLIHDSVTGLYKKEVDLLTV
jgi:CRISPR-associated endonuclease Csn1